MEKYKKYLKRENNCQTEMEGSMGIGKEERRGGGVNEKQNLESGVKKNIFKN